MSWIVRNLIFPNCPWPIRLRWQAILFSPRFIIKGNRYMDRSINALPKMELSKTERKYIAIWCWTIRSRKPFCGSKPWRKNVSAYCWEKTASGFWIRWTSRIWKTRFFPWFAFISPGNTTWFVREWKRTKTNRWLKSLTSTKKCKRSIRWPEIRN